MAIFSGFGRFKENPYSTRTIKCNANTLCCMLKCRIDLDGSMQLLLSVLGTAKGVEKMAEIWSQSRAPEKRPFFQVLAELWRTHSRPE